MLGINLRVSICKVWILVLWLIFPDQYKKYLIIRKIQIKAIKYHVTPVKLTVSGNRFIWSLIPECRHNSSLEHAGQALHYPQNELNKNSVDVDVEKKEPSFPANINVDRFNYFRKQYGYFSKILEFSFHVIQKFSASIPRARKCY